MASSGASVNTESFYLHSIPFAHTTAAGHPSERIGVVQIRLGSSDETVFTVGGVSFLPDRPCQLSPAAIGRPITIDEEGTLKIRIDAEREQTVGSWDSNAENYLFDAEYMGIRWERLPPSIRPAPYTSTQAEALRQFISADQPAVMQSAPQEEEPPARRREQEERPVDQSDQRPEDDRGRPVGQSSAALDKGQQFNADLPESMPVRPPVNSSAAPEQSTGQPKQDGERRAVKRSAEGGSAEKRRRQPKSVIRLPRGLARSPRDDYRPTGEDGGKDAVISSDCRSPTRSPRTGPPVLADMQPGPSGMNNPQDDQPSTQRRSVLHATRRKRKSSSGPQSPMVV